MRDSATQKIPKAHFALRVGQGQVEDAVQGIAQFGEEEGNASCLGLEQVAKRRLLARMLLLGEAGALDKVHDGEGPVFEFAAKASGGFQVLPLQFRVLLQKLLGITLHHRKIREPADGPKHQVPALGGLDEETGRGNVTMERLEEHQDVEP